VGVESLQVYTLNETSGLWQSVPDSTVDKSRQVVVARVRHLSIFSAFGVGAVAGPLVANRLGDNSARWLRRAIVGGFALLPLAWFIIGAAPSLPLALAGCVLRGMGGSINWTYSDVLLQSAVPDSFLGRVYSIDFGLFTLALSLSLWLTGLVTDWFALAPRAVVLLLAAGSLAPLGLWSAALRLRGGRLVDL